MWSAINGSMLSGGLSRDLSLTGSASPVMNLATILADPAQIGDLPMLERKALIGQLAAEITRMAALIVQLQVAAPDLEHDRGLSIREAAKAMGASQSWLEKHVQGLPFARRRGGRWVLSERGIQEWLGGRR